MLRNMVGKINKIVICYKIISTKTGKFSIIIIPLQNELISNKKILISISNYFQILFINLTTSFYQLAATGVLSKQKKINQKFYPILK